jgi:hypothetical protein
MAVDLRRRREATRLVGTALENVWQSLESGKWISRAALKEACLIDDDTLTQIIIFLGRWEFVDIKSSPEPLLRRKLGSISPMETFGVLCGLANKSPTPPTRFSIAERVACRACNWQELSFVGVNEVECDRCHERQWYTIELREEAQFLRRLRFVDRVLVWLGLPQRNQDNIVA